MYCTYQGTDCVYDNDENIDYLNVREYKFPNKNIKGRIYRDRQKGSIGMHFSLSKEFRAAFQDEVLFKLILTMLFIHQ